jgi:hypothetical protein
LTDSVTEFRELTITCFRNPLVSRFMEKIA